MKQKQAVHYYVLSVIHVLSNTTVIIITVYYSTEWVLHKSLEGVLRSATNNRHTWRSS